MAVRSSNGAAVVVVGAGMAGLTAARVLTQSGHRVTVLDKGRRPGGRLSTKSFGDGGRADAGAQFFTVRSEEFDRAVEEWRRSGLVREWCQGFGAEDGHPRYAVRGGAAELGAAMAAGMDVRSSIHVERISRRSGRICVEWRRSGSTERGRTPADVIVVTAPAPQSASLVEDLLEVPPLAYNPTLAWMVEVDRDVVISGSGGLQLSEDPIWSFVGDNKVKGTSGKPTVTFHSTGEFSSRHFDDEASALGDFLMDGSRPYLGNAAVIETQLHRWRYAAPVDLYPHRVLVSGDGRVVVAGDAFGEPRVEGAFLSGLAASSTVG